MKDFELSPEELRRLREAAEARAKEEDDLRRAGLEGAPAARPDAPGEIASVAPPALPPIESSQTEPKQPATAAKACPKCGFAFGWDGKRCRHCNYTEAGTEPQPEQSLPGQRGRFFPRLDPSTPVSELIRSPFVILLLVCWLPSVFLLLVIGLGIWEGPPKADYPFGGKTWPSKEQERAALSAYERRNAFDGIWGAAFYGGLSGPLMLGLGLYVVLTEHKSGQFSFSSAKIKLGYGLIAVAGVLVVAGAPAWISYTIWRYCTF